MTNKEWLETKVDKDCDFMCKVCRYKDDCDGGVKCYGGQPLFPVCADNDWDYYVDWDLVEELKDWNDLIKKLKVENK